MAVTSDVPRHKTSLGSQWAHHQLLEVLQFCLRYEIIELLSGNTEHYTLCSTLLRALPETVLDETNLFANKN